MRPQRTWPWPEGTRVPCSVWRGGTSRALIFRESDLSPDPQIRDRMILAAMGSPDPRQIDGLGGGYPLASKVAIVEETNDQEADVLFTFAQVATDLPLVDYSGTCGNISAAIGPWAIDQGLVEALEPVTRVGVRNTNTGKRFVTHVPVRDGRPVTRGDYVIDGVPNPGAEVRVEFLDAGGGVTGVLLPTGQPRDTLRVDGEEIEASVLDVGNPAVLVPLEALGLRPHETTELLERDGALRERLLAIREAGARAAALAVAEDGEVPAHIPKIAVVAAPGRFTTLSGRTVDRSEIDVLAWALTMGRLHRAYPVTAAMATAVAALIPGTVVADRVARIGPRLRIGHPSGVLEIEAEVSGTDAWPPVVDRVVVGRTARKIIEGEVVLP